MKLSIISISIIFVLGCTSKKEEILIKSYSQNRDYHKKLQKTEKVQLYNKDGVTKLLLTATYLDSKKDEKFIIGIYEDDLSKNLSKYKLTMNGQESKSIKKLALYDKELNNISFITEWSNYYLVSFPYTHHKKLIVNFESKEYGKLELYFAKVAKYIFEKKAF